MTLGQEANIWSESLQQTWLIAERKLEAKSDDPFIKDDCWSTVAWPSNKSLLTRNTNFTFSSLASLFFFPFYPRCQKRCFLSTRLLQMVFLLSLLFPGVMRSKFSSCKLMISVWIVAPLLGSCWFVWQKACVRLSRLHRRARIIKYMGVGEGCVCLLRLRCGKWWCTQTFTYDLTDDRRTQLSRFILICLFVPPLSLTHRRMGTFIVHLGDDTRHTMHALLYRSPHGT